MSFREQSAWLMTAALLLTGLFYFSFVARLSSELGEIAPPLLPVVGLYLAVLIVLAVVGHVLAAAFAPKDATADMDERDRLIAARSGNLSGYILAAGALLALGHYLVAHNGNALFHGVFASLLISQMAEYGLRILFYRRAV